MFKQDLADLGYGTYDAATAKQLTVGVLVGQDETTVALKRFRSSVAQALREAVSRIRRIELKMLQRPKMRIDERARGTSAVACVEHLGADGEYVQNLVGYCAAVEQKACALSQQHTGNRVRS
ncbi:hypothetical protein [Azoarcus taiwanensis]|uniref:hypothetical protein n=1 Tax=Azoarcus taiwanensis TaxID=666964 RepID=UPI001FE8D39D|nr:hypothetical protein [Azoarcus taiwanensis]